MKKILIALISLFVLIIVGACATSPDRQKPQNLATAHQWDMAEIEMLKSLMLSSLEPKIDETNRLVSNRNAVKLGQMLFFSTAFSANKKIACASCHLPDKYFTDGLPQSHGLETVKRNAPTIVGASQNNWFFLDGRTDSLWAQAMGPIENPLEHGSSRGQFAHAISADDDLRRAYEAIFGPLTDMSDAKRFPTHAGPIRQDKVAYKAWKSMTQDDQQTITNIFVNGAKSIAAFEAQLQPAPSKFDHYAQAVIQQDIEKIQSLYSEDEASGLKLFIGKANCTICHNGPMFTDFGFHNIATPQLDVKKYDFGRRKAIDKVKRNPFNCLGAYSDAKQKTCEELKFMVYDEHETMGAFKTPGLRNVSKTAPYMHAGQYKSLSDVIKHYTDTPETTIGQNDLLDIKLTSIEKRQLELFLLTLDSNIGKSNLIESLE